MRFTRGILSFVALVVFMGLVATGIAHAQSIEDWFRIRGYQMSTNVSAIAAEDTLTPKASHILAVTHPVLENNGSVFGADCLQHEQTIVLGCYHSGISFLSKDSSLFVYNVKNPRLHGVQEVTVAHEMLHAAYDRLSGNERVRVDAMLMDFYKNGLADQRVKDTIDAYKQTEPSDLVNEMHSVFGTEVSSLPAPLENYYKKYFANRQAVVAFADGYEGEFTSRTNQINADDVKLKQMRQQIEVEEQRLSAQLSSLESDRSAVERSDDPAVVNSYNARVAAYNSGVRSLQTDITAYNELVDQRNSLASELRSLQASLDSRLTAQPAQ